MSARFAVRSSGGSAAIVALRSCWRAASAAIVESNVVTRLASWFCRDASARNTCSLPCTAPLRSCGWEPSRAWLTIAEALNAPAEYFSERFSACAAVRPRTLGSWVASWAAVGVLLSAPPKPCTSVSRLARALEFSAREHAVELDRARGVGRRQRLPGVFSAGAFGEPGCRST